MVTLSGLAKSKELPSKPCNPEVRRGLMSLTLNPKP